MKRISLLVFVAAVACSGCDHFKEKQLLGDWKVIEASEDGMPIPVEVSVIGFRFMPNGYYNFSSTVNYKEAGTFSVSGDLLYTLDTINEASSEKAVKILGLSNDSLSLQMNTEGKIRILKLAKVPLGN